MRPQADERQRASAVPHSATPDKQWTNHEHVSDRGAGKAQELVREMGSQELAKQAIDAADDSRPDDGIQPHDEMRAAFARALGFPSFEELLTASKEIESNDGMHWYLTPLPDQHWAAWNEVQLHLDRHYASKEEALASVPHEANFSGSSLLG